MKVVIVDYDMGNVKSISGALKFIGINDVQLSCAKEDILTADKIILPGVGSFAKAMHNIGERNLQAILDEVILQQKKPILGICLGMQLLGLSSTEQGNNLGLGFINGEVVRFKAGIKVPHVGFNQVTVNSNTKLYHRLEGALDFYFTHSYRMETTHSINQSMCHYEDESFVASYEIDHIAGVQFHPELSQTNGIKLLKNFIEKF